MEGAFRQHAVWASASDDHQNQAVEVSFRDHDCSKWHSVGAWQVVTPCNVYCGWLLSSGIFLFWMRVSEGSPDNATFVAHYQDFSSRLWMSARGSCEHQSMA